MGLISTTTNLSYARNQLIKVGTSFIFDKVADMIYYCMTNDDISTTTTATFAMGTSGSPISYTAGSPPFKIYATSSNTTSTNAEPFYVKSVMTGDGGYGGRARFHAYTEADLQTNFMALKAHTQFGSSGTIAGLATALCAEIQLDNANVGAGGVCCLELEYVAGGSGTVTGGSLTGSYGTFIYMNSSNDAAGDFDNNCFLFSIQGLTDSDGNVLYRNTLRIGVGTTTWYLPLSTTQGTYTSVWPIALTNTLTVGTSGTGHDVQFHGDTSSSYMLWDADTDSLKILQTAKTTASNGVYSDLVCSGAWTAGNMTALRGRATISGSNNFVSATGVWAGLIMTGSTGSGSGLTCAINAEVESNNSQKPNAILYLQSLPGSSADFSDMPYMVFSETRGGAAGTGSNILFEVGHVPAGTTCPTGSGELFYNPTLKVKVNGTAYYLILSATENKLDLGDSSGGIDIGSATTGIEFTGTCTQAISFPAANIATALEFADAFAGIVISTGTYASDVDKGVILTSSNPRPVCFLFDDSDATLGAGNYRGVLSRIYIGHDQAGQIAIRGIRGQLKFATGADINVGQNQYGSMNGVDGMIETAGTHTMGSKTRIAGVHATIGIASGTVTLNHVLAGLMAELNINSTGSISGGITAGLYIDQVHVDHGLTCPWPYAIYVTNASVLLAVPGGATCAKGFNIGTGATTNAVEFDGASTNWSTWYLENTGGTGSNFGLRMYVYNDDNRTAGQLGCARFGVVPVTGKDVKGTCALRVSVDLPATTTASGNGWAESTIAAKFQLTGGSGCSVAEDYVIYAYRAMASDTTGACALVRLEENSANAYQAQTFIALYGQCDYAFEISQFTESTDHARLSTTVSGSQAGWIKVKMGASSRYIPLYPGTN